MALTFGEDLEEETSFGALSANKGPEPIPLRTTFALKDEEFLQIGPPEIQPGSCASLAEGEAGSRPDPKRSGDFEQLVGNTIFESGTTDSVHGSCLDGRWPLDGSRGQHFPAKCRKGSSQSFFCRGG